MKQHSFAAFLVQLFGIAIISYGALFIVFTKVQPQPNMPLEVMVLLLFGVTGFAHYIILKAGKKGPSQFTYAFMFTSVVRLIIYGLFIILYGYKHTDIAKPFAITFFALYLIFTFFEIRSVLSHLKGSK